MLLGQKVASMSKSAWIIKGLTESAFFQLIFDDLLIVLFCLIFDTRYRITTQLCVSLTTKVIDVLNSLSLRQSSASHIPRDTQTAR